MHGVRSAQSPDVQVQHAPCAGCPSPIPAHPQCPAPRTFFMTLATAISKSSCVTCTRRSRSANMPDSVQQPLSSAPDALLIMLAIFCRSMPRVRFIFL